MNHADPDFIRLRWFYRRLAQIGHPGAIEITLKEIDRLRPCFASICSYLASVQSISKQEWEHLGGQLLHVLAREEVQDNEYFKLSILSLFSRNKWINHFGRLASMYEGSDSYTKREILLAAKINERVDWLREHKESFSRMDPWWQAAFIYCCKELPTDEREKFLNSQDIARPSLQALKSWAKRR